MIFSSLGETEYSTTPDNIKAAQDLIQELANRGADTTIIECHAAIHSKQKPNLESACKKL